MKKTFAVFSAFVFILLSAVFPLSLSGCDNPTSSSAKTPLIETIPIIYITTSDLSPIPDNKNTVDCLVTLENGGKGYFETDLTATVRARGNGSLEVGKKHGKIPYKLKFEKKINLFGVGAAPSKDWVLIANMGDYTMLRNYTAKRLGAMLEGIPYSTASIPISLYVNNQYAGVYELTEQVEASPHRVPVDDNLTGTENGFLVELDRYAVSAEAGDLTFSVGQNYYTVKSKVANNDQFEYIKRKISDVDAAIYSGERNRIEKLVDMDSLIDMYLLQEFSKNIDAGFSSFYMYMNPGEKLVFAPPWDFDLAFGNDGILLFIKTTGLKPKQAAVGRSFPALTSLPLLRRFPLYQRSLPPIWRPISPAGHEPKVRAIN